MALVRWDPWREMVAVEREMQDVLRRFLGDTTPFAGYGLTGRTGYMPAVDVFTREGDVVVRAELPGIDPERDVEIQLRENVLTIRGERRHEKTEGSGESYFRKETQYGSFERHIAVPQGTKAEDIHATYQDGVLEIVVPKAAQLSAAKKIPVEVGEKRKALTARGRKK